MSIVKNNGLESSLQLDHNHVREVVDAFVNFFSAEIPDHLLQGNPTKNGAEIDLSAIFNVLTSLRMQDGWTADYDYCLFGKLGMPKVFALNPTQRGGTVVARGTRPAPPGAIGPVPLRDLLGRRSSDSKAKEPSCFWGTVYLHAPHQKGGEDREV